MTETLSTAVGEERATTGTPFTEGRTGGFGWRRLQVAAVLAMIASFLVPMAIELSLEPFLLGMVVPLVIGLLVMRRWRRIGVIWVGVIALVELLFSAPFLADALTHPESVADFLPLSVFTVSSFVAAIATRPSLREPTAQASGRPRAIAIWAASLLSAGAIVSIVATLGVESVPARAGDIRVGAQDMEFHPPSFDADAGSVSVAVTNNDSFRHTFTIDELGVDLELPPNTTQRVSFTVEPGTYRFYCRPHDPDMEGELAVR